MRQVYNRYIPNKVRYVKPFVPPATLQTIYKALIQPYFDYCSPLWDRKNTSR